MFPPKAKTDLIDDSPVFYISSLEICTNRSIVYFIAKLNKICQYPQIKCPSEVG